MKSSVKIEIYGNRERYWGYVRFTDSEGTEHVRTAAGKREDSLKSNTLQALIECLKLLIRPCMVDVYTKMDEIIEPFKQGWIYNWEKNDWTNAKGRHVQCADQWQEAKLLLSEHSVRFMKMEDDKQ